jgi:hypothetical protein
MSNGADLEGGGPRRPDTAFGNQQVSDIVFLHDCPQPAQGQTDCPLHSLAANQFSIKCKLGQAVPRQSCF